MPLRLLCTTAHPDDEVWGFGGALLRYREQGVETFVVCMTRGRAATNRGGAASGDELAEMRATEYYEACKLLNVTRAELLDYPDGGLTKIDFNDAAGELTRLVREIKPNVILT